MFRDQRVIIMHILIVEDEERVANFLKGALSEEGHSVQVSHDGADGLRIAQSAEFDLIVLDWMLPGMDGRSICEELRSTGNRCPILMLTARVAVADRISGLDSGADDYLIKPFALGEFLARVRSLLRRGQSSLPRLHAGNLILDPATHSVTVDTKPVFLTAKEYSLLEYLLRNIGRSLSRAMIAEHVWQFDFDSETNVVDVYINYLRKKVDPTHSLIRTVRGVGYQLVVPSEES
jgi:DNA-binding response OmpR family regulator